MNAVTETLLESLIPRGDRYRELPERFPSGMMDLCSNDYLGVGNDPEIYAFFMENVVLDNMRKGSPVPAGSLASRLMYVNNPYYGRIEDRLASAYSKEAALLFNSGYHANTGILPALASARSLVVADKLVHASIIDGMKLAGCECTRYRHNDLAHLERILASKASSFDYVIVVTESVFSMDGDRADLKGLVSLKKKYDNLLLYVDEAHAFGLYGDRGLGVCEEEDVAGDIDMIVGTFGKAYASCGAFVVTSGTVKRILVNRSRPLIFSTAFPPLSAAWILMLLEARAGYAENAVSSRLSVLAGRFFSNVGHFRKLLDAALAGIDGHVPEDGKASMAAMIRKYLQVSSSHIFPIVVGTDEKALAFSSYLRENGIAVKAIRPPTVPAGTSRLRLSVNASLSDSCIDLLVGKIRDYVLMNEKTGL